MPLIFAPEGEKVNVVRLSADDATRRRLENLGITVGAELMPLSFSGGNMIVRVHDSRLALDRAVANSIFVRRAS